MPATKRKAAKSGTSAKDAHFEALKKVQDEHNAIGSMLVVGIDSEEGSEEEEPEEEPEYTAEQVSKLRHILINKSRAAEIEKAEDFCTCGQADDGFMSFGTSSGNDICFGIPGEVKKAMARKELPKKFDAMLGLTAGLKEHDFWMHDNECWEPGQELEKSIKALGNAWRKLLKESDAALGIDTEYTRPGIEALLSQLEEDFKDCEASQDFEFKWRA